jgi:basic membrane lipoprotein Med (substrate-binding protein (PBP1-ABC) superfamily)
MIGHREARRASLSRAARTAVRFAEDQATELVGYLSGLVAPRGRPARERADIVSVVGGIPTPQVQRTIASAE